MEQYTQQPDAVAVYPLDGSTDLILRKNIAQAETDEGTVWQCEERQLRVPRVLTVEDVAASFDSWWDYTPGADDPDDISTASTPGKEERLEALESAILEMAGLLPNGDEGDRLDALESAVTEIATLLPNGDENDRLAALEKAQKKISDALASSDEDDRLTQLEKLISDLKKQAEEIPDLKAELLSLKDENASLTQKVAQMAATNVAETEETDG